MRRLGGPNTRCQTPSTQPDAAQDARPGQPLHRDRSTKSAGDIGVATTDLTGKLASPLLKPGGMRSSRFGNNKTGVVESNQPDMVTAVVLTAASVEASVDEIENHFVSPFQFRMRRGEEDVPPRRFVLLACFLPETERFPSDGVLHKMLRGRAKRTHILCGHLPFVTCGRPTELGEYRKGVVAAVVAVAKNVEFRQMPRKTGVLHDDNRANCEPIVSAIGVFLIKQH